MRDLDGTPLKPGQHIVISWFGGSLTRAVILALEPRGRRQETGTLVLLLPDGRTYRRRHYGYDQCLVVGRRE